jgi:ubiquitin-like 1-activating enzyme E1 B
MAGNIIPAIAATNAIVAGLLVLEAVKALANPAEIGQNCRAVFVERAQKSRIRLLNSTLLPAPVPTCSVCSADEIRLTVDMSVFTVGALVDRVLKGTLGLTVLLRLSLFLESFSPQYSTNMPRVSLLPTGP